jgi:hypothetical protein
MEMAMKNHVTGKLAVATLVLAAVPALQAADETAAIKGEVVGFHPGGKIEQGFEPDRITVRTRGGETRDLLLGEPGSCPDCVRVGDRVRARVMNGDPAGAPLRVREMKVRRTGESFTYRNEAGELVRTRARSREGAGPGSHGSSGSGPAHRSRQSGARGGGGRGGCPRR